MAWRRPHEDNALTAPRPAATLAPRRGKGEGTMNSKKSVLISLALGATLLAVLVLAVGRGPEGVGASAFNPSFTAEISSSQGSAAADVTLSVNIPAPSANASKAVAFVPTAWTVASDSGVPAGALVGTMDFLMATGIINSACNQILPVYVNLMDATVNTGDTVGHGGGFLDANSNGLPDAVDRYPARLAAALPGLTPYARYYGQTVIAGTPTAFHVVVFSPGELPEFDAALGYPMVFIMDLTDPAVPAPRAITNLCTGFQFTQRILGVSQDNSDTVTNEAGATVRRNPSSGQHTFRHYFLSLRDADDDGIENELDTCPLLANAGDPRVWESGDADADGLDAACDPNDDSSTGGTNSDQDGDGYLNRGDNCPLSPNGQSGANQADADKDGIGDACDPSPAVASGHVHEVTLTGSVDVGGGSTTVTPTPSTPTPTLTHAPTPTPAPTPTLSPTPSATPTLTPTPTATPPGQTPTPTPSATPPGQTPSPTHTPTPTPTPTPTLAPTPPSNSGDMNCDGAVTAVDSLAILRYVAGLPPLAQHEPCPDVGQPPADPFGDVNCDGQVTAVDALFTLRHVAGLPVNLPPGCAPVGPVSS